MKPVKPAKLVKPVKLVQPVNLVKPVKPVNPVKSGDMTSERPTQEDLRASVAALAALPVFPSAKWYFYHISTTIVMANTTWTSRLKPGMKAPEFEATLDDGSTVSSRDLKGKPVVLFFYNHDGTETCTIEACNIRDNYPALVKKGFQVIGVSEDSVRKHQNFKKKYKLPYPLISDKDNVLAKRFDVYGEKHFMGRVFDAVHRTTFVIGSDWKINEVIHPVISANHAVQIL